jgi:hypothetical protein
VEEEPNLPESAGFNGDTFHTRNCPDSGVRQKVINDTNLISVDKTLLHLIAQENRSEASQGGDVFLCPLGYSPLAS